jgi:hypothetical protein
MEFQHGFNQCIKTLEVVRNDEKSAVIYIIQDCDLQNYAIHKNNDKTKPKARTVNNSLSE